MAMFLEYAHWAGRPEVPQVFGGNCGVVWRVTKTVPVTLLGVLLVDATLGLIWIMTVFLPSDDDIQQPVSTVGSCSFS